MNLYQHTRATEDGDGANVPQRVGTPSQRTPAIITNHVASEERGDETTGPPIVGEDETEIEQGENLSPSSTNLARQDNDEEVLSSSSSSSSSQPPQDEQGNAQVVAATAPASEETAFHAVLADDPQLTRDKMLENAVEAEDVRVFDDTGKSSRWMPLAIVALVLLVLAAVGATLGVVIPRRNSISGMAAPTETPSEAPSAAPSQAPTSGSFAVVAEAVESVFGMTLDDTTSPQYRAAEWMAEEDQLISLPLEDLSRFAQRYAMVVFYYATGGDTSWNRQANFLSSNLDHCSWQEDAPFGAETVLGILGVQCSEQGQVLAIEFLRNNLTGTLPDEIGAFPVLSALILNWNSLVGSIPTTIFNSNFQYLSLPFNNITGTLPTEMGTHGTLLQLWLQESSLTGTIPTELGSNTGLLALTLSYSFLNGTLPETLEALKELFILDLSNNNLSGNLPQDFSSRWPKLQQVTFNSNRFTGQLPNAFASLTELRVLSFSDNSFTGRIPDSIMSINTLEFLSFESNALSGTLPNDWSRLSLMRQLSLSDNNLTGSLPASMGTMTLLTLFSLASNGFNSTIPTELGNLTLMENMLFQGNELAGPVPSSLRQWTSLQRITFNYNLLTGDMSFLCDQSDETEPFTPTLIELHADCLGEVICPCCTICCRPDDSCEFQ